MQIMHPTVWKELTTAWEATFGEPLSNEILVKPPPKGRMRFPSLAKSDIGASRLAASSAQEVRAGRRLSRACAKAAKPPKAIGAHLPAEWTNFWAQESKCKYCCPLRVGLVLAVPECSDAIFPGVWTRKNKNSRISTKRCSIWWMTFFGTWASEAQNTPREGDEQNYCLL